MKTTFLAIVTIAVASILFVQLESGDEAPTTSGLFPQELAAEMPPANELALSPLASGHRVRPDFAPPAAEEIPEVVGESTTSAPDGWLRMAPAPDNEPYLPQLELDVKSELRAELERLSWTDNFWRMFDGQSVSRAAYIKQVQVERRKGNYDIMSLAGVHGAWGEELLPDHYQGSLWYSFDAKNGTAEIVRLSPVEFRQIYVDRWRVEVAKELSQANHNRVPGERLHPRTPAASASK